MSLSDLRVGDTAAVLNGRLSSVFFCKVTDIVADDIHVYVPEKDAQQVYDRETGESRNSSHAILVTRDDKRAELLSIRRDFQDLHKRVMLATKRFHEDPSIPNGQALLEYVHVWHEFARFSPEPEALLAESIPDYYDRIARSRSQT